MGKMKKSVKAIIFSVVSVVCVLAISLGLILGLKKPSENPPADSALSASQKQLANEVNDGIVHLGYDVMGMPYKNICALSEIKRFGLNYFSFTSGNRERFYTYKEKTDGTFETKELTDDSVYSFVQAGAANSKVEAVTDTHVLFVSYFDVNPYATENTKLYYSVVDISDFENPTEIFSFDTRTKNYLILNDANKFVLKDNYFAFYYLTNANKTEGTADYNFYAFPYAKTKIDFSVATNKNFITDLNFKNGESNVEFFDSSFVVFAENTYNVFYLKNGGFEKITKNIVMQDEYILKDYEFKEVANNVLLITTSDFVINQDDIISTSVLHDTGASGNAYVNYSYKLFNTASANPTEKVISIESGYAFAHSEAKEENALNNFFRLTFEKVDAENKPSGEYIAVYYDAQANQVLKFVANDENEELLYVSDNTFLTANRILSVNKSVSATQKVNFEEKEVRYETNQTPSEMFVVSDLNDGFKGVMKLDGTFAIVAENSGYSDIKDIVDGKCRVYRGSLTYIYDFAAEDGEYIDGYVNDGLISVSNIDLYIQMLGQDNYVVKDYLGNVKVSGVTSYKVSSVMGVSFLEISKTEDKKPTDIICVADINKINQNSSFMSVSLQSLDIQNNPNFGDQVAAPYGTTMSNSYVSATITQQENPTMVATFKDSYVPNGMNFNLHFFNNYTLTLSNTVLANGSLSVTRTYSGDTISHSVTLDSTGRIVYTVQFSFTNWFGYGDVEIRSLSGSCTRKFYYFYFKRSNATTYSDDINLFSKMTTDAACYSGYYLESIAGDFNVVAPDSTSTIKECHIDSWIYYSQVGSGATAIFAPSDFNTNSNTPKDTSYSGGSYYVRAEAGETKAMIGALYYDTAYYYAAYEANTYTFKASYSGYGTDISASVSVFATVGVAAPKNRPGYNWTGWTINGTENISGFAHQVQWNSTSGTWSAFTGTSSTYSLGTNAATSSLYLKNLRKTSGTVTLTPVWQAGVYEIELVNSTTTDSTITAGTQYVYSKYNYGVYFDEACTNSYTANSSSKVITLPTKTDYVFAGYFTGENGAGSMFIDPTGKRTSNFKNNHFVADGKLYAYWTNVQYTIKYDDGVVGGSTTTITCYFGRVYSVTLPSSTARRGYTFKGWKVTGLDGTSDPDGGYTHRYGTTATITSMTKFTSTTQEIVGRYTHFYNLRSTEGEVVLTSLWDPITYHVTFDSDGGTAVADKTCKFDTVYTVTAPTKRGYLFTGWDVELMEYGFDHIFSGSGVSNLTTQESSGFFTKEYVSFKNLRSNDDETVVFTARWTPIKYKVRYNLSGGSWDGTEGRTIFGVDDTQPATEISYMEEVYFPFPNNSPFGYKFNKWHVDALASDYAVIQSGSDYGLKCRNMADTQGAIVDIYLTQENADTGVGEEDGGWIYITYNYQFLPGFGQAEDSESYDHFVSSYPTGTIKYNTEFTVEAPLRTGYVFVGWALSALSDECRHYTEIADEDGNLFYTEFSSINGLYVNPDNPNEYIGSYNRFKNLHNEQGATVILTALWDYEECDLYYHYVAPGYYTSVPTEEAVNTVSNMTGEKLVKVKINNYFKTLTAASSEYIDDGVVLPMGYRLKGWVLTVNLISLSTGALSTYEIPSSSRTYNYSPYTEPFDTNVFLSLDYIKAGNVYGGVNLSGRVIDEFNLYAVYEPVDIELVIYQASSDSNLNNISGYSNVSTIITRYSNNFSLNFPQYCSGYMISVNYLDSGTVHHTTSISRYSINGTSYDMVPTTFNNNTPWGLPNTYAYNPQYPKFYLYAVYTKIDLTNVLSFAYNSRLGGYTLTGYDKSEYNKNYDAITVAGGFDIPATYDDGIHGSASVVSIGSYALEGMYVPGVMHIPSSVKEIGTGAFSGFSASEGVTGGQTISKLAVGAFDGLDINSDVVLWNLWDYILGYNWKVINYYGEEETTFRASSVTSFDSYVGSRFEKA